MGAHLHAALLHLIQLLAAHAAGAVLVGAVKLLHSHVSVDALHLASTVARRLQKVLPFTLLYCCCWLLLLGGEWWLCL